MAIAFDTSTNASLASEATKSFSHVCNGSILFVEIGADSGRTVTAVTYGGVGQPLTLGKNEFGSGGARFISVWYKIGPLTGSNTVAVTLDDVCSGGITASSWAGVGSLGTWVSNASAGTTSIDVASAVGDTAVDFKQTGVGASVTPGGSQTLVYDYDQGAGTERLYSSKIPGGSPTVTMSWSDSGGNYTNHVGVSMTPSADTVLKGVGMAG